MMRNIPAAIQDYHSALEINPFKIKALINLGICYSIKKDYKNAEIYLNRAREIAPHFKATKLELARIYQATGRDQAAELLLQSIKQE